MVDKFPTSTGKDGFLNRQLYFNICSIVKTRNWTHFFAVMKLFLISGTWNTQVYTHRQSTKIDKNCITSWWLHLPVFIVMGCVWHAPRVFRFLRTSFRSSNASWLWVWHRQRIGRQIRWNRGYGIRIKWSGNRMKSPQSNNSSLQHTDYYYISLHDYWVEQTETIRMKAFKNNCMLWFPKVQGLDQWCKSIWRKLSMTTPNNCTESPWCGLLLLDVVWWVGFHVCSVASAGRSLVVSIDSCYGYLPSACFPVFLSRESSLAICIRIHTEIQYMFFVVLVTQDQNHSDNPWKIILLPAKYIFISLSFFWNTNFRTERTLVYRRRQPPNVLLRSWRNWATWVPWWHGRTSWDKSSRWWWWWWWWSYCFLFV